MTHTYKFRKTFTMYGKRYEVRADTERELYAKLLARMDEVEKGTIKLDRHMTVREWSLYCFKTYRKPKIKPVTYEKYINRLNHCINEKIGDMRICDVRRIHLQTCLNDQSGNSTYQIRQVMQMMKYIFDQAVIDDLLIKSPALGIVEPSGTKTERRSLTKSEEELFLKVALATHKYDVFLLSYYCGCRPEEARKCMMDDISEKDGYHLLHIRGTKTAKSDRFVPLPDILYLHIKNAPESEIIAPNGYNNMHNQDSYKRAWNSLKREMNIALGCKMYRNKLLPPFPLADDLAPYSLRHTYCTNLQTKYDIDVRTASRLMGHSSIQITADIYTHIGTEQITEAARIIKEKTPE